MNDNLANHDLIRTCCRELAGIEGDAAEIGVYRGQSGHLICHLLPDSTVYLFDTYCGIPKTLCIVGTDGGYRGGEFGDTSLLMVKERCADMSNARFIEGEFSQVCSTVTAQLKFVHIDCDLYESTKAALAWAWPLMVDGGIILDDDYLCGSTPGAAKAMNEFAQREGIQIERVGTRGIIRRQPV